MLLAIDIGNTNIVIGVFKGQEWQHIWRLETSHNKSPQNYEKDLREFFLEHSLSFSHIRGSVLSSVVPVLTPVFQSLLANLLNGQPVVIGQSIYGKLPLQIANPEQIGADLVANAMGAYHLFEKAPCIIVDFGTALTFTAMDEKGKIRGVSIAPGLKTATKALFLNTAQLPDVPLELPQSAIGTDTISAIQAGLMWGYAGLVEFMLNKIAEEMGTQPKIVATGGLSFVYAEALTVFDVTSPELTLDGLVAIWKSVNP